MGVAMVTVLVDDYDRAIAFFTSALGFVVEQDAPATTNDGRPKRWVVVREPDGGAALLLARADGPAQEAVVGRQGGGRVSFFLHVADVDLAVDGVERNGGHLVRPPRDEPYGRVAVVADPWGNRWDLLLPR